MTKWFGWAGTILRVDLTRMKVFKQPLDKEFASKFLGGRGFNQATIFNEIKPDIDPLGPENVLCFGIGPLTGTIMPGSGRHSVDAKSPLTGIVGSANSGGDWGAELKHSGYDQIVFTGKAEKPVYLWIDDDDVEIKGAEDIWGTTTWEADKLIKKDLGDDRIKIVYIGQAGENLVRFAAVMNDLARAAGRTGMGAVMGSKNLKAIAIRGTQGVEIAKPREFVELAEKDLKGLLEDIGYKRFASVGTWNLFDALLDANNRNFQTHIYRSKEGYEYTELPDYFMWKYVVRLHGCFSCPVHCSHYYNITTGPYAGTRGEGMEWSSAHFMGCNTNISMDAWIKANNLANIYGMDTITLGVVIGVAMHLYQDGIITGKDTDGIPLEWGNEESVMTMIHRIARREGFGNILAEGGYGMTQIIGKGAGKYFGHVNGMSMNDLRRLMRLGRYTSTRGADHLRNEGPVSESSLAELLGINEASEEEKDSHRTERIKGKGTLIAWNEEFNAVFDSLTRCRFNGGMVFASFPLGIFAGTASFRIPADYIALGTGWKITEEEVKKIGERIYNIEASFNAREGIARKAITIPLQFRTPIPDGHYKGEIVSTEQLNEFLDDYYSVRGWDVKTGIPSRKKMEELGLNYVADELERASLPQSRYVGPPLWPLEKYHTSRT